MFPSLYKKSVELVLLPVPQLKALASPDYLQRATQKPTPI